MRRADFQVSSELKVKAFQMEQISGSLRSSSRIKGHVLVVDDSSDIRIVASGLLTQFGAVCHTASTHQEALALVLREKNILHAIVDYEMPKQSPSLLVERLREIRPNIHIIGWSGRDYSSEFGEMGVNQFLRKPWNVQELINFLTL